MKPTSKPNEPVRIIPSEQPSPDGLDAAACSLSFDTPETDGALLKILVDRGVLDHRNAPECLVVLARKLECERNEAITALRHIHQILAGKDELGQDLMLGSTAFKSCLRWSRSVGIEFEANS